MSERGRLRAPPVPLSKTDPRVPWARPRKAPNGPIIVMDGSVFE